MGFLSKANLHAKNGLELKETYPAKAQSYRKNNRQLR